MIYYIDEEREKRNTAGAKAPDDIAEICRRAGYERIVLPYMAITKSSPKQKAWIYFTCEKFWRKVMKTVNEGDVVIFQHPTYGKRSSIRMIPKIREKKKCRFIAVIHDLESLRGGIKGVVRDNRKTNTLGDTVLLKEFDAIICHNDHMKKYMISQGFDENKLVSLELFDYLSEVHREPSEKSEKPSIAIAGNLAPGKCGYIYKIKDENKNRDLTVNLYGNRYDETQAKGELNYRGSFRPEELPAYLHGDFGLVWDGPEDTTCAGNTGNYLRYNNPHKTSLYLSCNMPVVIWSEAALADFIRDNHAGITVDKLEDLSEAIRNVSDEEYAEICANIAKISERLHNGAYFTEALGKALQILGAK